MEPRAKRTMTQRGRSPPHWSVCRTTGALHRLCRAVRVAARRWGISLGWIEHEGINETDPVLFLSNAFEYYAAARFAVYAKRVGVCGNITHRAVEMFLKGGLARYRTLSELQAFRHNLKRTWRAFKTDFPDPALCRHDKTISLLNRFEELRYPSHDGPAVIEIEIVWGPTWPGIPATSRSHPGMKRPRKYYLAMGDIDDLVADVFKAIKWNPIFFTTRHPNPAALEAITRDNKHADYLTKPPP
jgi:hypothetical protein